MFAGRFARKLTARVLVLAAALGGWQALSATGTLPPADFPAMTATAASLADQLGTPQLWVAVRDTLHGWGIGLLIGAGGAIVVGALLGLNRFAYRSAMPVVEFFKTIPAIAILPLVILLFGPTVQMKYVLIAFGVFWPMVIQVGYGVRATDPIARDTARVLQVRGVRRFAVVTLPSAAPFIATGLRVAAAVGLILSVVAELIGGASGVGQRILTAENSGPSAYPIMYAYIVVAGTLGVVLAGLFALAERRVLHWHESQREDTGSGVRP
jgi:ABC-type nitrate/sulfonate/bicarbonate transport system permease component